MRPSFRLQISADAFTTGSGFQHAYKVAAILRLAANRIEDSAQFAHKLTDQDGQTVGRCGLDDSSAAPKPNCTRCRKIPGRSDTGLCDSCESAAGMSEQWGCR